MKPPRLPPDGVADIGLVLEGTYPYVRGGVSSWVHEIVSGLPEFTFGVVFIGSDPADYDPIRYELPKNLVHLETHYLSERPPTTGKGRARGKVEAFDEMAALHDRLRERDMGLTDALLTAMSAIETPEGLSWHDFVSNDESWHQVCASYHRFCTSPSFVDYFWTVRTMHGPLFQIARAAATVPRFKVVHSVSTGYAGFMGALLRQRRKCPYILTEHGIYTKERKIDLANAQWIRDVREELASGLEEDTTYVRRLWVRFFEGLGRVAYASATPIVALYEGNRQRQIEDGAEAARTRVVPNGIDLARFAPAAAARPAKVPPVLGLMGRVVPIKDIRTFIRAMRTVVSAMPEAEGWIIGPEDEDPRYAAECRQLVASLGLGDRVKFLGFQKPEEIFPQLGLTVLTSISEALPLVVLESFASGVPVVTTDVGSCRELLEGNAPEDRALGAAGAAVPISDPEATAAAALSYLRDPARWAAAARAGMARVQRYYTRPQMFDSYRKIYKTALEAAGGGNRFRAA